MINKVSNIYIKQFIYQQNYFDLRRQIMKYYGVFIQLNIPFFAAEKYSAYSKYGKIIDSKILRIKNNYAS